MAAILDRLPLPEDVLDVIARKLHKAELQDLWPEYLSEVLVRAHAALNDATRRLQEMYQDILWNNIVWEEAELDGVRAEMLYYHDVLVGNPPDWRGRAWTEEMDDAFGVYRDLPLLMTDDEDEEWDTDSTD